MSTNKPIPINQTTFRILYFRFKPYFVSVGVMIVCFILFLQIIVPQIQQWFAERDQALQEQQKISVLSQNLNIITKIDSKTLDTDSQIVAQALPPEKDFAGVLDAVSNAAVNANVALGDYSFTVGTISTNITTANENLQLTLNINGGIDDVKRFIVALKSQLPLSDVTDVKINSSRSSTIIVIFYIKPFPKFTFNNSTPLVGLTAQDTTLINELKNYALNKQQLPTVGATVP